MNGIGCSNASRSAVLKSPRWKSAPKLHGAKQLTSMNLETVNGARVKRRSPD
jgi:hypothetical protein